MSTLISTIPYSGTTLSSRFQKTRKPKNHARTLLAESSTSATTQLASRLEGISSNGSEKFLQDHMTAIFFGLYMETALGPIMGALVIYLYSLWMM